MGTPIPGYGHIVSRYEEEQTSANSVFADRFAHPNAYGTSQIRKTLAAMPVGRGKQKVYDGFYEAKIKLQKVITLTLNKGGDYDQNKSYACDFSISIFGLHCMCW